MPRLHLTTAEDLKQLSGIAFMIVNHKGICPEEQRENTVCAREQQGAYTLLLDSMHGDSVGTRKSIRMCPATYYLPIYLSSLSVHLKLCHSLSI